MAIIHSASLSGNFLHAVLGVYGTQHSAVMMSGVQPTPAQLLANWQTTYSYPNNCLAAFDFTLSPVQPGVLYTITTAKSVTAFKTGVASWAIMWPNNGYTSTSQYSNSGPPNPAFIIVPVTDATADGVFRLSTTSLVNGQQFNVTDVSFTAQMV